MKIKFCGAAREVTGSAHLITLDSGYKILLDAGLYQGHKEEMDKFNETWMFDPQSVDTVILSHAHIDHSGRLPKLVKDGFIGNIFSTHATKSLCSLMLLDSAKIQERDAEFYNKRLKKKKKSKKKPRVPLYNIEDVSNTMNMFVGFGYNQWHTIAEGIELLFRDAGHILGGANVTLRINEDGKETIIGFTGDIGRPDRPILRDPQPMPEVDYLLMESTYGDRDHLSKPGEEQKLLDVMIKTCVEKKGKLIIPAFSVGRTQEIVYMMDDMWNKGLLPRVPVYVDSPLAVNVTEVFGQHPECFDDELLEYMIDDDNPFGFGSLTYIKKVDKSKELNKSNKPCVIISASGMMNAGRVKHHLYNNIDIEKNTFLIVGYCAPNTPGGMLRAGVEEIRLFGEWKPVRAEIEVIDSLSAHGDRNEMIDFISNQKTRLKQLFVVHGEYDAQKSFKNLLEKKGFKNITIPRLKDEVTLD